MTVGKKTVRVRESGGNGDSFMALALALALAHFKRMEKRQLNKFKDN